LAHKRSNLQLAVGASYSYGPPRIAQTPRVLDSIAKVWLT
jgi:hypothetical protein